jgi:Family of unknown function (DUF5995)
VAGLALLTGGCGEDEVSPPAPGASGGQRWESIVGAMPDRLEPGSANVCGRGGAGCIAAVVDEMNRRLQELATACDHNAPFALMYLRVTEAVGITGAQRFRDHSYLNHLDAVFADLYFTAFDAWRSGDRDAVPEAWRIAFEAADEREASGLGDMLLGMNAHISRDLPFALARTGLRTPDGRSAEADFDRVNTLLADVQAPMIEEQTTRFDPGIGRATLPVLTVDAETIGRLLTRWRTEAWENAERLILLQGDARERLGEQIEEAAAGRARLIETLTSNLVLGPGADERDDYCEDSSESR